MSRVHTRAPPRVRGGVGPNPGQQDRLHPTLPTSALAHPQGPDPGTPLSRHLSICRLRCDRRTTQHPEREEVRAAPASVRFSHGREPPVTISGPVTGPVLKCTRLNTGCVGGALPSVELPPKCGSRTPCLKTTQRRLLSIQIPGPQHRVGFRKSEVGVAGPPADPTLRNAARGLRTPPTMRDERGRGWDTRKPRQGLPAARGGPNRPEARACSPGRP